MTKRHGRILLLSALALGAAGPAMWAARSEASDHQDTPEVELNPQLDINDVWAFPGSSDDRIVLAVTLASPLVGSQNARFDPNALYQIKVDNNKDGREDVVFQFSFDQLANGNQTVDVIGPVAPAPATGTFSGPASGVLGNPGVRDRFSSATPAIRRGAVGTNLTANLAASGAAAAGQMQVFAGLRDDPFYIDLEQFFRIVPDRRPATGPLSNLGNLPRASAFRPKCDASGNAPSNAAPFQNNQGCAKDFLRGFNALAIVVELPESQVTQGRSSGEIGVWATISR